MEAKFRIMKAKFRIFWKCLKKYHIVHLRFFSKVFSMTKMLHVFLILAEHTNAVLVKVNEHIYFYLFTFLLYGKVKLK